MRNVRRGLAVVLALVMLLPSILIPGMAAGKYQDVPDSSWYSAAVEYVTEKGYMAGVSEDSFAPNTPVTRAMFVTVLAKVAGVKGLDDTASVFSDVPAGKWYTGSVAWAAQNGIVSGVSATEFAPNRKITRQDMCLILSKFVQVMEYELPQNGAASFNDAATISSYARGAVAECTAANLIAGFSDGTFRPKGTATRAQIAVIIMRLAELLEGKPVDPVPMPAQSFNGAAGEDMNVAVNAPEGALPEGTGMALAPVTDEASLEILAAKAQSRVFAAADISFIKDGEEIEPNAAVEVQISLDNLQNIENPTVVHINKSGNVEAVSGVEMVSTNRAGTEKALRFYAKDFSVYAVIGDGETGDNARLTVEFYDSTRTGAAPVKSYTLTKHDIVTVDGSKSIESVVPDPAVSQTQNTMTFCGWTTNDDYTADDLLNTDGTYKDCSLDAIRQQIITLLESGTVKEGDTYKVYAMYFNNFVVTYLNETGSTIVKSDSIYTKQSKMDYTIYAPYTAENNGYAFRGWTVVGSSASAVLENFEEVEIEESISLKAYVRMGKWITFYEKTNDSDEYKGATYTPPKFILDSELKTTDKPANPTLPGYTFSGWYEKGTNNPFTFSNRTLDRNYDLEAHWTRNTVANYTVLFWKQNLAGTGYDFDKSQIVRNATVDNSTSVTKNGSGNDTYVTVDGVETKYEGFRVRETNGYETATVKPDGSTVINVYFDRNQYTFTFQDTDGTYNRVTANSVSSTAIGNGEYYVRVTINSTDKYWKVEDKTSSYTYAAVPADDFASISGSSYTDYSSTPFVAVQNGSYYPVYWYGSSTGWVIRVSSSSIYYLEDAQVYYRSNPTYYYQPNYTTIHTVTKPYGADIVDIWKFTGSNGKTYPQTDPVSSWQPTNSTTYTARITKIPKMPAEDITYRHMTTSNTKRRFVYYVEALPESENKVTISGKEYVVYDDFENDFNIVFYNDDFWELNGFIRDRITDSTGKSITIAEDGTPWTSSSSDTTTVSGQFASGATENTLYFLYDRESYSILYQDGMYYSHSKDNSTGENQILGRDKVDYRTYIHEDGNILYQDDITSYDVGGANYYIPTLTGFDFQGWYLDSACQNPATTTTLAKMPLDGVVLYAKWQQRAIRVVLDANGGTLPDGQASNFKIDEYEDISDGQEIKPTRDGYEFVGWYQDPHFVTPFNFATKLYYNAGDDESTADAYSDADRAAYGDSTRPFVVGIRKLYAKWRKDLPGANGLTVIYKADDLNNPSTGTGTFSSDYDGSDNKTSTDKKPYQDGTEAIGRAASDPESGKRFLYWEYTNQAGETVHVYPGKPFTLNAADAEVSDVNSQSLVGSTASVNPAAALNRSIGGGKRPLAAEEATTLASWDFEDNSLTGWTRFDSDGDGYQFAVAENPSTATISHGGTYYLRSDSYINVSSTNGEALTPNNWICTPAVNLPADGTNTISFWAKGVDASFASEVISVYVTTNISNTGRIVSNGTLLEKITLTGEYKQYSYTIPSSYSGKVYIVLRHHDVTDMFALAVDDMEVVNTPEQASTGDEVYWEPTDEIVDDEEYLIGYVDANGDTWLVMNYNPDTSTSYQTLNFSSGYSSYSSKCAFAIKAIKDNYTLAGNVTGVDTSSVSNATMDNVVFTFSPNNNGRLIYHENRYLSIDTTASGTGTNTLSFYTDSYKSSSDQFYRFNYANHKLTITVTNNSGTSVTKTVYCVTNSSTGTVSGFGARSGDPGTTSTIQLYRKVIVQNETKYTVRFYGWNGALIDTQEVAEYGAANAPAQSELGMPAGYSFAGWNPTGFDYVTEDMDVYAQFETQSGATVYTVTFVDKNYNVLKTETVVEGDDATAPAAPAPESGYHFVGWDVDYTNVHSNLVVVPVYEKNVTKQYAITLHAVYAPIEPQKKTHVTWYANNGTDAMDDSDNVFINEGFDIETFEMFRDGTGAELEYPGYTFLGWARLPERPEHVNTYAPAKLRDESMYETYVDTVDGTTKIKSYYGLNEEDLWLVYHPADENHTEAYFTVKNETGMTDGTEVTQIAPNEKMPYHGLYAVWKRDVFYVVHSSTGVMEAVSMPVGTGDAPAGMSYPVGTADLTSFVQPGYLYGGYYTDKNYDGLAYGYIEHTAVQAEADAYTASSVSVGWTAVPTSATSAVASPIARKTISGFHVYDGSSLYTNGTNKAYMKEGDDYVRDDQGNIKKWPAVWTAADAETVNGKTMTPVANKVYYLKEVSSKYLTSKIIYTYDTTLGNKIIDVYLLSLYDDGNYQKDKAGFYVNVGGTTTSTDNFKSKTGLSTSFTLVQQAGSDGDPANPVATTVTAENFGLTGGAVLVTRMTELATDANTKTFTMLPTWTTPDGVTIYNNGLTVNFNDDKNELTWNRSFDGTEKMYINVAQGIIDGQPKWGADNAVVKVRFYKVQGTYESNCSEWVLAEKTGSGDIRVITVPAGDWKYFQIGRFPPDGVTWNDNNYTSQMPIRSSATNGANSAENFVTKFYMSGTECEWGHFPN
ncbi:MAG: S-layer homology domain-containing protein [Oscillospiraceae bacterium]|nr:S-layer homology domain-containing protein [Oscillospiraceae bacterium]